MGVEKERKDEAALASSPEAWNLNQICLSIRY